MKGEKNHIKKRFLKFKCFSPLRILTSPLFEETLGAFLFFLFFLFLSFSFSLSLFSILFLSFFSMLRLLRTWVLMIFEEKNHFFKNFLFKWLHMEWLGHDCGYTGGGLIFWNRVMHTNIA
jgi:hypothetical protein